MSGLGLGGAAREFVGVGEKAVAALLLGSMQRMSGARLCAATRLRPRRVRCVDLDNGRRLGGAALAFGLERRQPRAIASRDGLQFALSTRAIRRASLRPPSGGTAAWSDTRHCLRGSSSQRQSVTARAAAPDRLAERAGEMRDRGIDRDHQIERR